MLIIYDESAATYHRIGHPERPQRVTATAALIRSANLPGVRFAKPGVPDVMKIRRFHDTEHIARLEQKEDFDEDTPAHPGIAGHARAAVGGALDALESAIGGEHAFSILRPPGHHAVADRAMGFCYLNQAAIAALEAVARGLKIAVFDFDVHHGNGTEDALRGVEGATFTSIHQFPAYPGTGKESFENIRNFPMAPWTPRKRYMDAVTAGMEHVLSQRPDIVICSAGFDAYRGDPLAQETLEAEDYRTIGRTFAQSGVKVAAVLEGGYSEDLPVLCLEFIKGLTGT